MMTAVIEQALTTIPFQAASPQVRQHLGPTAASQQRLAVSYPPGTNPARPPPPSDAGRTERAV